MNFRDPVLFLLLLSTTALAAGCGGGEGRVPSGESGAEPPILLISIDTLRADRLPVYGYEGVDTPAIDRLRRDALLFANAYTTNPTTLPAHASLLTGLLPTLHGVRDNVGYRLDAAAHPTLAQRLSGVGYATGAAVSAYVLRGRTGLAAGFDDYDDGIEVTGSGNLGQLQRAGSETVAVARRWIDSQREEPFFFFLHLFEPHSPYAPPAPFAERYEDPYDGEIAAADAAVGELLDHLREVGLYDRMTIVLLSDHGEGLGDHGEEEHGILLYRSTVRVPLLLKLPGGARAGETVTEVAHLVDVVPTVLELAGAPVSEGVSGVSLLDLAADGTQTERRLYSETYYPRLHLGWSELTSLVGKRFHFIDGPTPELFDVLSDPEQRLNVLQSERPTAREMRRQLEELRSELERPTATSEADAERLAALGYLTRGAQSSGELPDPRTVMPVLQDVKEAYAAAGRGEHRRAVGILSRLVEAYPAMVDARFQLGTSLQALGQDREALALFEEGLELSPTAADGMLVEMARILARQGELERAVEHARAALEALPAEAYGILAQIALAQGDGTEALRLARQAVAAERRPRADSLLLLGRLHLVQGDFETGLEVFDRLRTRVREEEGVPVRGLELERGEALSRLGRLEEAAAAFRSEISGFPADAAAYARLAVLSVALGRPQEVDPLLERMVAANPSRRTFLLAAETVERLGNPEEGARWRRRAAALGES